jgi:UV DNA damage endonuclease
MRIGYPCINTGIGCTTNSTFRLASFNRERFLETVNGNLGCLSKILEYNLRRGFLFFRISSDLVPFASHPVCDVRWQEIFKKDFQRMGRLIKKSNVRISMHPDQFILLNSPRQDVVERSVAELEYHCELLDLMGLDDSAKVQIHVGGVYGEKESAVERFCRVYPELPARIRKRLAIENDDRLYSLQDCLEISAKTGVPIIFDSFHHECLNRGETRREALLLAQKTWKKKDGVPMTDYSSQQKGARKGKHSETIDIRHFKKYIRETEGIDFDIMLEIKDKEKSAEKALMVVSSRR